ncbi:hypothetical protein DZE36_21035 [Xanthomonas campestris pv. campestris]|nr:hypothetical protein DZE36_21035 [Xanthomonas campestris pv. campestris]
MCVGRVGGVGGGEGGVGNRESGIGKREAGSGNRESGIGNRESGKALRRSMSYFPSADQRQHVGEPLVDSPFPIPAVNQPKS